MRRLLVLVALSGCDIVFHIDPIGPGSGSGSGVADALPPSADSVPPVCAPVGKYGISGAGFLQYCVRSDAQDLLEISGAAVINTTANAMCDYVHSDGPSQVPVCVLAAKAIAIDGKLAVVGDKPLVFAASDTITISGSIDLTGGGGADPMACTTAGIGAPGAAGGTGGGGGGGGGGWGTRGGKGGAGKAGTQAAAGPAAASAVEIRGGCGGGAGGMGANSNGGAAGLGGGAIYLIAGTAIHVAGTAVIDASGSGGAGGNTPDGGGGGGGAGGLIAFDSPLVTFAFDQTPGSTLFANGGGGGAGGNGTAGSRSTGPTTAGAGASPNGGNGALAATAGTAGTAGSSNGGGGGGGGQGFILLFSIGPYTDNTTFVSPPITVGS